MRSISLKFWYMISKQTRVDSVIFGEWYRSYSSLTIITITLVLCTVLQRTRYNVYKYGW